MLHAHVAIWKERGHFTTRGSPIKYGDQILQLLEAVHLPTEVSVSHCKGHQKGNTEVARGNQAADQADVDRPDPQEVLVSKEACLQFYR